MPNAKCQRSLTALTHFTSRLIAAMNKGEITVAVMADFSAKVFDTVAYETVLQKLHKFGFSKHGLKWFASYLSERKQSVQIDDCKSSELEVTFGVPRSRSLSTFMSMTQLNTYRQLSKPTNMPTTPLSMPTANRSPSARAMPRYRRLLTSSVVGPRITTSFFNSTKTTILDKKSWNTWCQRSLINRLSPLPHYNVGLNSNGKQTTLHGVGGGGDVNL